MYKKVYHFPMLLLLFLVGNVCLCAQDFPKVNDPAADQYLVGLAQSSWRPQGAALSYDGQTLYMSLHPVSSPDANLYMAVKKNNKWQAPQLLQNVSSDKNDWYPAISTDEQTLYFIREDIINPGQRKEYRETNIYASARQADGSWQEPQKMPVSSGSDTRLLALADNKTICFSSLRDATDKKAQPKRYFMRKLDKYNWTIPEPVGEGVTESSLCGRLVRIEGNAINANSQLPIPAKVTVYDMITQKRLAEFCCDEKGQFLVGLAEGRMYKLDLYKEGYSHAYLSVDALQLERDSVLPWQGALAPELQLVLHTYDRENMAEIFPSVQVKELPGNKAMKVQEADDHRGKLLALPIGKDYAVSLHLDTYADTSFVINTRRDVLFPQAEIDMQMQVGKTPVHLRVVDGSTGEGLPAEVLLTDCSALVPEQTSLTLPEVGTDTLLRYAASYRAEVRSVGYMFRDTLFRAPQLPTPSEVIIPLVQLRAALIVQLRNIQFEFNSHLLTEESSTELHLIADLMRQNPTLSIELSAHTDDIGSADYNKRLSDRRAASAMNYLIEQENIDAQRMTSVGYGKEQPLVPNDSDENRAINRRVEFKITNL